MLSREIEAELEQELFWTDPLRTLRWGLIRSTARDRALEEFQWWGGGRRTESDAAGDREVRNRLLTYFRATREGVPREPIWNTPWSGAFISWVLREAGVPRDQFRFSRGHWKYVHAAIHNAASDPDHPIQAFPVDRVTPRVGDLICSSRGRRVTTFAELADMPTAAYRPLHCDLVTEVRPSYVMAVGGNKAPSGARRCQPGASGCTVNRTRRALRDGVLAPFQNAGQGWVAVVRIGP